MSQTEQIVKHLEQHGSITSLEAFATYQVTRLSGLIYALKKRGYKFETELEPQNRSKFVRYTLIKEGE